MEKDLTNASIADLVAKYASAAAAHGTASFVSFDRHQADRNHEILVSICRELRRRGRAAQAALLTLLRNDDRNVRFWAAMHALEFAPHDAEPVMRAVSAIEDVLGLQAEMILRDWRKGKLTFP